MCAWWTQKWVFKKVEKNLLTLRLDTTTLGKGTYEQGKHVTSDFDAGERESVYVVLSCV